ncbi:membrane protein [Halanaerocella petrolearia]
MPKFTVGGDKDMPTVLGVFNGESEAKTAVDKMKEKGISEDKISLVAKQDGNDNIEAGEEMAGNDQNLADGATTGGALGGAAGILAGAGLLAIPGVGPVLAAGPVAAGLTGAATGGVAGGLVDYGLDQETGERYAGEVEQGKILVAAEDTDENKINEVSDILRKEGANDVATH